ncbi:GNAT family N-acetyltransferase [Streptosporangium amethystogenes]|uniref:GNAT family N-acetyltransferase n=1 Tax=Streptosporangium amethystogenes TaxID=2002 RepID=UPI0004C857D0|nr:GNAT family N-acetyltransferase [Streptosporangium amethystogenes]
MTVDSTRPAPGAEDILWATPPPRRVGGTVEMHHVAVRDPRVRPLLEDLHAEYNSRYGPNEEINRYPDERFTPEQGGAFLILTEDGQTVAGGAFFRRDEETAELKRIWTHPGHRRRGLGVAVVRELEREAARQGYRRIHLTTGPRQPEAAGLYLATGYTPLYDRGADPETIGPHPFEKTIREARTG